MRQAHFAYGLSPHQRLVPYRSIGHLIQCRAQESPDALFLIDYDAQHQRTALTMAQFVAQVNRIANFLAARGVKPGDRIATLAHNHRDTVLLYFACWALGATVAPQNIAEDDQRIAFILRNSAAVLVFAQPEYLARVAHIIRPQPDSPQQLGAPNVREIIQLGGQAEPGYVNLHAELDKFSTHFQPAPPPTLESAALLVYTSGTTGAPKGVVLTQYNLLVDAHGIAAWQGITGKQRLMCVLPIHHVNGIVVTLITPLYAGASTVLNRSFSPRYFWQRLAQEHVHIVSVVPTLLQFACEYADQQAIAGKSIYGDGVQHDDLTHFRHIICGAGTLSVALARRFENQFGMRILHGYGLSDTTCYSCFMPIDLDWQTHQHWLQSYGYPSIGSPILTNEMAIFDAAGEGQRLAAGQRGEICIRGHNVMAGYFQREDANAAAFPFGWFRSGDEGFYELDEQGRPFFFITGRIKELINRGGVKFSPFDIEEILLAYPGVNIGLAIAFHNTYYGEEVGAYIVPETGAEVDAAALLTFCRERLTFEKSPKVVIFGDDIPVTSTGKYQRLKLRDQFAPWRDVQFRADQE